MELMNINHLHASVEDKNIIKDLNLKINAGEIHVVMGPNGAGKSTLAYTLMGHPKYTVTQGDVSFLGQDLFELKVDERAKSGLFMSFQHPEVIPGVTVENFFKDSKNIHYRRKAKRHWISSRTYKIITKLKYG